MTLIRTFFSLHSGVRTRGEKMATMSAILISLSRGGAEPFRQGQKFTMSPEYDLGLRLRAPPSSATSSSSLEASTGMLLSPARRCRQRCVWTTIVGLMELCPHTRRRILALRSYLLSACLKPLSRSNHKHTHCTHIVHPSPVQPHSLFLALSSCAVAIVATSCDLLFVFLPVEMLRLGK